MSAVGSKASRSAAATAVAPAAKPRSLATLALGALGVVYGDIGTSPLYALRQCLTGDASGPANPQAVLGLLSLVFWSLTVIICVKYLTVMMRADNRGEGGILALLALVVPHGGAVTDSGRRRALVLLGLFGAALLYGDGVITPAISVLSAVEGLQLATNALQPYVVPITIAVLVVLFAVQRRGTARVGATFGPVMVVWFLVIGGLGLASIVTQSPRQPSVLHAIDPTYAAGYLARGGGAGFLVLGSVVLAITGAEALYADMGHFGPHPIRAAWYAVVYPALLLNYFGQGALALDRGAAATHPFFQLAPSWALYPLIGLATAATVIASQALISGAFSLTHQAIQLGYAPRLHVVHTAKAVRGQIYMPQVNLILMVACIALVLGFRRSSAMANAYGIAVAGTMTITSLLFYVVARERWRWSRAAAAALVALFLLFDASFLGANLVKIASGGWVPVGLATIIFTVMTTWRRGRLELHQVLAAKSIPLDRLLAELERRRVRRRPGTAVFISVDASGIPPVLLRHVRHEEAVYERVVLLTVVSDSRPTVSDAECVTLTELGHGFYRLVARFGFTEPPSIERIARCAAMLGLPIDVGDTTFFFTREGEQAASELPMAPWRRQLFGLTSRRAALTTTALGIPRERVVEIGPSHQ